VEPRPRAAATVILLRDVEQGIETFVMRRTTTMAFAPRMHVFPGGRVDAIDSDVDLHFVGADAEDLAVRASTDAPGVRALYACAIRETAEEAGIDLVRPDDAGLLTIDVAALPIVDHWVTPVSESRRYDVRFFAAVVEDARLTTTEADDAAWVTPQVAVAEFEAGRMAMLPPTEAVLRWLCGFERAADAVAAGARRPIVALMPQESGAGHWELINERTGEVVDPYVAMPHTRETDGLPRSPV
jgi:8-oxo-dGTP pyrophosphatase MutT (NUDIX family)